MSWGFVSACFDWTVTSKVAEDSAAAVRLDAGVTGQGNNIRARSGCSPSTQQRHRKILRTRCQHERPLAGNGAADGRTPGRSGPPQTLLRTQRRRIISTATRTITTAAPPPTSNRLSFVDSSTAGANSALEPMSSWPE